MEVNAHKEYRTYVIELKGELDALSALLVDQAIEKAIETYPEHLCVDCKELQYISSAGLGVFISHLQNLQGKNIRLSLFNLKPTIKNVFDTLGLTPIIPIVSSKQEALMNN